MAYGMGRAYLRGTIWWIQFCVGGRRFREPVPSAHTRDEALHALAQRRLAEVGSPDDTTVQAQTLAMLCALVLQRYRRKKQASLPTAEGHAKAWLAALSGDTRLASLTVERLGDVIEAWDDDGYAPATINRRLAFLKVGLRLAKLPRHIDFADLRRGEDNVRDVYVAPAEFARLYAEAMAYDPDLADYLAWLYASGMRRGEASQLTFDMVDRRRWVLLIPGRVQKHRKHRGIFLGGAMQDLIAKRFEARVRGCDYIFHRAGDRIQSFTKSWKTLCAKAGLDAIRPHDLRRSAVTNLLEMGLTPKEAMEITGHRTLAVFTRYQQLPEASFRAKLAAMPAPWTNPPPLAA